MYVIVGGKPLKLYNRKDGTRYYMRSGKRVSLKSNQRVIKSLTSYDTKPPKRSTKVKKQTYFTHDNGGNPFLVIVEGDRVKIYKSRKDNFDVVESEYTIPVKTYSKVLRVMPGKSPKTAMTIFSGGYGPAFYGNTILIQLSPLRYAFIGDEVYEFSVNRGEKILEYISPVGNNDVPYPVAIGENNIYFMNDESYIPLSVFPKLTRTVKDDAYAYYYGHLQDEKVSHNAMKKAERKMKARKSIHGRVW